MSSVGVCTFPAVPTQGAIPEEGRYKKIIINVNFAGFLFHTVPPSERLDRSDAHFVDVLHSAGLWIGSDEVVTKKQTKLRK